MFDEAKKKQQADKQKKEEAKRAEERRRKSVNNIFVDLVLFSFLNFFHQKNSPSSSSSVHDRMFNEAKKKQQADKDKVDEARRKSMEKRTPKRSDGSPSIFDR